MSPGTGDFCIEAWLNPDTWGNDDGHYILDNGGPQFNSDGTNYIFKKHGGSTILSSTNPKTGQWTHVAVTRSGTSLKMFYNGEEVDSATDSTNFTGTAITYIGSSIDYYNGKISNLRFVKGSAVYTGSFTPPTAALTNITNTQLLCCQDTSSATTAAVGSLSGSGTAGSYTVSASGTITYSLGTITWPSSITWNGGSAPTLVSANTRSTAGQVFNLVTADTGTTWYGYEEVDADTQTFGLYSAGENWLGELGQNDRIQRSSPTQVGSDTTWSSLIGVDAGYNGGGLKSDGTLWVMGSSGNGMLGLNQGPGNSRSSPTQIPGTTWDNACAGGNDSRGMLGVKTDGTLWVWGGNEYGSLGQNNLTGYSSPVQVPGTTWKWASYAGEDYILAVKTNGELYSWGHNQAGALGINATGKRSSPCQIPGTTWAFADGNRAGTSIATRTDGTLWAWGYNAKGELAQNNNAGSPGNGISSPVQIPGTSWSYDHGSKIAAGYQRLFAIRTDGTLWSWGQNEEGQLGLNDVVYRSSPTQIPGTTWTTISQVGDAVAATKTDGTLWTWGDNSAGALMQNSNVHRSSPVQIAGTWNTGQRGVSSCTEGVLALKVQ